MRSLAYHLGLFTAILISVGISTSWSSPSDPIYISTSYLPPNENHPEWQQEILKKAPPGLQIAVGTERGFMGLGINPQATGLVLIDRDPKVVKYNEINIAFLKLAETRREYQRLRFAENYSDWEKAGLKLDRSAWDFWQTYVIGDGRFKEFNNPKSQFFEDSNYLFSPDRFEKLSKLAKTGKIKTELLDLREPKELRGFVNRLKLRGEQLSVLDISNAWQKQYMKGEALSNLLKEFGTWANPKSILMITRRNLSDGPTQSFIYEAYTFENLVNPETVAHSLQAQEYKRGLPNAALNPKDSVSAFGAKSSFFSCFLRRLRLP